MPVKRRVAKVKRADLAELNREQRRHLLSGCGYFGLAFRDEDEERAAWEIHGEQLLAEHIVKFPGTRPKAWWKFDAPDSHPPFIDAADEGRYPPWAFKVVDGDLVRVTQEEADYLDARGLLTPEEIAALDSVDDDDE
jgi:hypothetical protein